MNYDNFRFLIVDTIKQSRDSLKQFAHTLGNVRVDMVSYVRDAVSYCQNADYDIVLMGYDLGEKQKNGQQLLEELRVKQLIDRHTIVIIITAEVSQAMVLAALEHKPDDYLTKPFTLNDLKRRLNKALTKKEAMNNIYQALDDQESNTVIKLCQQNIERYPQYKAECYGILSRQYFELEQFEQAQAIYHLYLNKPHCQWAAIGLGKIALHQEDYSQAIEHFQSIIDNTPKYLKAYDWLAKAYQEQGNVTKAELALEQGLVISPRSVGRLKNYAMLCLENENYDKATSAFQQTNNLAINSVHHKPENALLFASSLLELFKMLPTSEAKKLSGQALQALTASAKTFNNEELTIQSHLLTAQLQIKLKEKAVANITINRAEKLLDTLRQDLSTQGTIDISKSLIQVDRKDSAAQLLTNLAQYHPDDSKLLETIDNCLGNKISNSATQAQKSIGIAMDLYHQKKYGQAINELNKALQLYPSHNVIKMNLLQVLIVAQEQGESTNQDLEQAKQLIAEFNKFSTKEYSQTRFLKLKAKHQQLNNPHIEKSINVTNA